MVAIRVLQGATNHREEIPGLLSRLLSLQGQLLDPKESDSERVNYSFFLQKSA